jgi:hypothetical protein
MMMIWHSKRFLVAVYFAERCEVLFVCCFLFMWFEVFSTVLPWFLQNFLEVDGWGVDGWFLLVSVTIFAFCLGRLLVGASKVFYLLSAI